MSDSTPETTAGAESGAISTGFLAAALRVLREAERPLSTTELTERALTAGALESRGRTPVNTMAAVLYLAVRDDPDCPIIRVYEPGRGRARRGSVRWALRANA
jgi:hypothetical protein